MADYIVPAGWKLFSREKNSATYIRPGHTAQVPKLAIFDRKVPEASDTNGTQWYRVRVIDGNVGDSNPPRDVIELNIRSNASSNQTNLAANLAVVGGMAADADFGNDAIVEQLLP